MLQGQKIALDGPDTGRGNVSVSRSELVGIVSYKPDHSLKVLEIQKKEPVVVGDFEGHGQNTAWVSFRFSMRPKSKGPISVMVVRTGCPCSPKTSQKTTGYPS